MASHRAAARAQVGTYFGGQFDEVNRCYRNATGLSTPTRITSVGTLRTHFPRAGSYPLSDHTHGQAAGVRSGGIIIAHLARQARRAITTGPTQRWKRTPYDVTLYLYLLSKTGHAEDAQDDLDDTVDSITDLIDADRTLGSGANGVFTDVGEAEQGVVVDFGKPVTRAQTVESTAEIGFVAVAYELA